MRGAHAIAASLVMWVACASPEGLPPVQQTDPGPSLRATVQDHFGVSIGGDEVVARVQGEAITATDVALWLDLMPTLSVEQAVQDLIDARLGRQMALRDGPEDLAPSLRDGRSRGEALAWLRAHAWHPPGGLVPRDDLLEHALENNVEVATLRGIPALRTVSHILLAPARRAAVQDDAWGQRAVERWRTRLEGVPNRERAREMSAIAREERAEAREHGYSIVVDRHLVIAETRDGPQRWRSSTPYVVEPFARAAFRTPLAEVVGPVRTDFGVHVIAVEAVFEAVPGDAEAARARAAELALAETRSRFTAVKVRELKEETPPFYFDELVDALANDDVGALVREQRGRSRTR